MKTKYYAVKNGRKNGIYYIWEECKKQVDKFSNCEYKSFETLEEANEYLGIKQNKNYQNNNIIKAYVDGSYDNTLKTYGFGVVILKDDNIIDEFSKKGNNNEMISMRNVAGEIEGAMFAMNYCIENSIDELNLYFDYEGIKKWCTGEWKANKSGTKNYKMFYEKIKSNLKVNFIKVKSHSGDYYNDYADKLAKKSLNI